MKRFVLAAVFLVACDFRPIGPRIDNPPKEDDPPTVPTGPSNAGPSLAVTSVSAQQIRQGGGGATISLGGTRLSSLMTATLGALPASLAVTNDTEAVVSTQVSHGALLGPVTLSLFAQDGSRVDVPAALTVTAICSAPSGSDTTGRGTTEAPFRSMTRALSVAATGDVVSLAAGDYSASAGETFPALLSVAYGAVAGTANVPAQISVIGAGSALTTISGPGDAPAQAGLILAGSTSIDGLTVRSFTHGIVATTGTQTVSDVLTTGASGAGFYVSEGNVVGTIASSGNGTGLYLAGSGAASSTLTNSVLSNNRRAGGACPPANGSRGLWVAGAASLSFIDGFVSRNAAVGVQMDSTGMLLLDGAQLSSNGPSGSNCSAQFRVQSGTTTLRGTSISEGSTFGVEALGSAVLNILDASVVERNERVALVAYGNASVRARNSTFELGPNFITTNHVVEMGGTLQQVDFGTSADPGQNSFFFDATGRTGTGGHGMLQDLRSSCVANASWVGSTFAMCYDRLDDLNRCNPVHMLSDPGGPLNGTVTSTQVACAAGASGATGPTACAGTGYALDLGTPACTHVFD